jgi:twitching motility protein PilT
MHTNSTVKTVDRVSGFFPPEEKAWVASVFSTVFRCVVSQTLLPRMDGNGRTLAYEIMMGTSDVRNNIKEQKINLIANSLSQGGQLGHVLMNSCLTKMVKDKIVSKEDALAHAYDREGLQKQLQAAML